MNACKWAVIIAGFFGLMGLALVVVGLPVTIHMVNHAGTYLDLIHTLPHSLEIRHISNRHHDLEQQDQAQKTGE